MACRWRWALVAGVLVAQVASTPAQPPTEPVPATPSSSGDFEMIVDESGAAATASTSEGPGQQTSSPADDQDDEEELSLADVIASLYRSYPEIIRARQQPAVSGGEWTSAYGEYDTTLGAFALSEPNGFYENYRSGLRAARRTWWGGYVEAGYRNGRGSFQPWYKERQTNEGGELKLGLAQPLLKGRAIDPQRVAVFQASLAQQAAFPIVQRSILDSSREAAAAYWQWVASGAILQAQRELLAIAEKRGQQFQAGVEAGKFAPIDLILNQQLIAERRTNLLEAEREFRASTFKLSLYLRDDTGMPMVPDDGWLPTQFPIIETPSFPEFEDELSAALTRRPELRILGFEFRQVQFDRRLAQNETLPRIDFISEVSQDLGKPASSTIDDKSQFEMMIGFASEVPIQRRNARGKIQSTTAKLAQINEKIRLTQDTIATELRAARNALLLSSQIVEQSEVALRLALETLERYRFAFDKGKIDLIYLNLLETKANESEIKLVEAQREWFASLAELQIVLGLDPLERAIAVSMLPSSDRPGPGNLPKPVPLNPEAFERDLQRGLQNPQP